MLVDPGSYITSGIILSVISDSCVLTGNKGSRYASMDIRNKTEQQI
jgi:hypothetical protein